MTTKPVIIGDATLYCGDCLEVLKSLPECCVDAVVSDPPFAFAGGLSNGFASRVDSQFFEFWLAEVFRQLHRVSAPTAPWFLWCDWRTASIYDEVLDKSADDYYDKRRVTQVVVHDRDMVGMGSPFRNQTDWIAVIRGKKTVFRDIPKDQPNVIRSYWYYGKHENHPAEKDPEIAKKFVEWACGPFLTVIDPFAGGGTTGIACAKTNRKFIGIEKDPAHFATAVRRITEAAAPNLLTGIDGTSASK
jgi:site-specific DNA-methyltransferase (adenine-specific)